MKNSSVIPLLEAWERFATENPQKDLYAFAYWILAEKQERDVSAATSTGSEARSARTAIQITRLQKYLSLCIRPSVKALGFTKEHEYNFLYQISRMNKPNKNDLSKENMVEFSTGRDVIRRLVEKQMVTEKPDPDDKRASILRITVKGRKTLEKSFRLITGQFTDFLGDLSAGEQEQLSGLLTRVIRYQAIKNRKEILSYL